MALLEAPEVRALPALLSITELSELLDMPRHVIRDHVAAGRIPSTTFGDHKKAKRYVSVAALRTAFPELYEAVMLKGEAYAAAKAARADADEDE